LYYNKVIFNVTYKEELLMIEVKEVNTRRQIKKFAAYPIELYKGCKFYVPSLRSDEINTFNPKRTLI